MGFCVVFTPVVIVSQSGHLIIKALSLLLKLTLCIKKLDKSDSFKGLLGLRENIIFKGYKPQFVKPLNISAFLLFNSEISPVYYPAFYFAEFELEAA